MRLIQKIGVTAFVYYDNKVLLVKRSDQESFLPNYFELPGGKVKFAESPIDALKREIKEEVNLDIKVIKPYSAFTYLSKNNTEQTVDIQFVCILINSNFEIKLSQEHDEYVWITEDEISKYTKITKQMKTAIKEGFLSLKSII